MKALFRPIFRRAIVPVARPITSRIRHYLFREILAELQSINQELWEIKEIQRENEALFFSAITALRNPIQVLET